MQMTLGQRVVVCGAGGFIGGHLVAALRNRGYEHIRAVDMKPVSGWYQTFADVENLVFDLRRPEACHAALEGAAAVFNLAADMGGIGCIESNKHAGRLSALANTH